MERETGGVGERSVRLTARFGAFFAAKSCIIKNKAVSLQAKTRNNTNTMKTTMRQTVKKVSDNVKKVSKGWQESLKTQGSIIVNDPQFA